MTRVVVAAFGNELRGDDGFGIAVLKRLEGAQSRAGVRLIEVGTAGLRLAQELLTPCDRLIIVDAMHGGGAPGTLYVKKVEAVRPAAAVDMHLTLPVQALAVASALGALPRDTFLVGCEPQHVDELTLELSEPVRAALEPAAMRVAELIGGADAE